MLVRLLDRHQRLLRLTLVAVCVFFGARAAADVVDAMAEASAAELPRARSATPSMIPVEPARQAAAVERKSGQALVDRNVFCSDCAPRTGPARSTSGEPPVTDLPLRLVATHIAADPRGRSSATVWSGSSAGAYQLGQRLPGAGPVVRIGGRSVDFENPSAGRVERVLLRVPVAEPAAAATRPAERAPTRPGRASDPELQAELDRGVRPVDETTFEVDRALIENVIARPQAAARGARVAIRDGGLGCSGSSRTPPTPGWVSRAATRSWR